MKPGSRLVHSQEVGAKVAAVFNKRMQVANDKFTKRVSEAFADVGPGSPAGQTPSIDPLGWYNYAVDATQRSILFWDTLAPARQQLHRELGARGSSRSCISTTRPCSTAAASSSRSTTRC